MKAIKILSIIAASAILAKVDFGQFFTAHAEQEKSVVFSTEPNIPYASDYLVFQIESAVINVVRERAE